MAGIGFGIYQTSNVAEKYGRKSWFELENGYLIQINLKKKLIKIYRK
jgi:hypothetical protein